MNLRMHSSRVPSIIRYGRAPREALTRSLLTDGHFLRVAGTSKFIWTSESGMVSVSPCSPSQFFARFLNRFRQRKRAFFGSRWSVPPKPPQRHKSSECNLPTFLCVEERSANQEH